MTPLFFSIGGGDSFDPAGTYGMELMEAEYRFGPPKKKHAVSSYIDEPGEHIDPRTVADAFDYKIKVLITARAPQTVASVIYAFNSDIKETDAGGVDRYKTLSITLPERGTTIVGIPDPIETPEDFFTWRNEQCAVTEIKLRVNDPSKCRWGNIGSVPPSPGTEAFTLKYKRGSDEFVFSDALLDILANNDVRLYARHSVGFSKGTQKPTRDPSRRFRRVCHAQIENGGAYDWRDQSLRITSPAVLKSELLQYIEGVMESPEQNADGVYIGSCDRRKWWSRFVSGVEWSKSNIGQGSLPDKTPFTTVYTTFALGICEDEATNRQAVGSIIDGTIFRVYFDGSTGTYNIRTKKGWVK